MPGVMAASSRDRVDLDEMAMTEATPLHHHHHHRHHHRITTTPIITTPPTTTPSITTIAIIANNNSPSQQPSPSPNLGKHRDREDSHQDPLCPQARQAWRSDVFPGTHRDQQDRNGGQDEGNVEKQQDLRSVLLAVVP